MRRIQRDLVASGAIGPIEALLAKATAAGGTRVAASSMEGRSGVAIEAARKVAANVQLEMIQEFPSVEFFHTIPLLALTQFGLWDEVLAEPQPPADLEFSNGIWHYVRATAYARKGDLGAAQAEYAKLVPLRDATDVKFLDSVQYPATMLLTIADALVLGEFAMAGRAFILFVTNVAGANLAGVSAFLLSGGTWA